MVSFTTIRQRLSDIRVRCERSGDENALTFAHFNSAFEIPVGHWGRLVGKNEAMLTVPFLAALEQHPATGMRFHYLLAYQGTEPVAAFYFQEFDLRIANVDRNVNTDNIGNAKSMMAGAKDVMAKSLEMFAVRMLVMGNVYLTGQYGVRFADAIPTNLQSEIIARATERITKDNSSGKRIKAIMLKDVDGPLPEAVTLSETDYIPFHVQPQMIVPIRWATFDEYLDAFSSKYRVRAKSAFKKFERIVMRELSLDEITALDQQIWKLYEEVESRAEFQLAALPHGYFIDLKIALEDRFRFVGFFDEGQLVGFYSTLLGKTRNVAHFIGMNYEVNRDCALYLNILYAQVRDAIADGVAELDTGRTALEIKSTVGCEPRQLQLLARHTNGFTNGVAKLFLSNLKQPEWIQRRPFKDQVEEPEAAEV